MSWISVATQKNVYFPLMHRQSGSSPKTAVLHVLTQQPAYSSLWFCCLNIWPPPWKFWKRKLEDGTSAPNSSAGCHVHSQLTQQNWSQGFTQLPVGWEMWESLWILGGQQRAPGTMEPRTSGKKLKLHWKEWWGTCGEMKHDVRKGRGDLWGPNGIDWHHKVVVFLRAMEDIGPLDGDGHQLYLSMAHRSCGGKEMKGPGSESSSAGLTDGTVGEKQKPWFVAVDNSCCVNLLPWPISNLPIDATGCRVRRRHARSTLVSLQSWAQWHRGSKAS